MKSAKVSMLFAAAITIMATAVVASPIHVTAENVPAVEYDARPLKKRGGICGGKPCHGHCVLMWCVPN
ncbi:hypothetical protein BGZ68_010048 [Mortierella alpina]|nr:hypothetical protein BGZ68_010048 [Mortierella alpina]